MLLQLFKLDYTVDGISEIFTNPYIVISSQVLPILSLVLVRETE